MINGIQLKASKKRAQELKQYGFRCCICADGLACAGAGKIIRHNKVPHLRCGNHTQTNGVQQQPLELSLEQATVCTRKSEHTKAPPGP